MTVSTAILPQAHSSLTASTYRLHDPIHINGNSGFNVTSGVSRGTGTASDPFIIEALEINGIIGIANTNSFFIIRNMLVNPDAFGFAVSFLKVANGEIANSTFMDSRWGGGISIQDSTNVIIRGNVVKGAVNLLGSSSGVVVSHNKLVGMVANGDHVVISQNNFTYGGLTLGATLSTLDTFTITPDNLVNRLPLYFYKDCKNLTVDGIKAGQIIIANCKGVRVTNLQMTGSPVPVSMFFVDSAVIRGNSINNSTEVALYLQNVTRTEISNNVLRNNADGIWLAGDNGIVSNNTIDHNGGGIGVNVLGRNQTISRNTLWRDWIALNLENSNFTIVGNVIYSNNYGITVGGDNPAGGGNTVGPLGKISGNIVSLNDRVGISVGFGDNLSIESNDISNNAIGLRISGQFTRNILFEHNNFVSNFQQVDTISANSMQGIYPTGGNFWSDYSGVDHCSGPFQNVCTGPDGIGDAPFAPDGRTILDNYPHMLPFGPPDVTPPHWLPESAVYASRITTTSVYLEWLLSTSAGTYALPGVSGALDDVGVTQFRVLQNGVTVMTVNAGSGAALVSNLSPGTTYSFKIEAGDTGNNWSVNGPSKTVTTLSTNPSGSNGNPSLPRGLLATLAGALANPLSYIVGGALAALVGLTGFVIRTKRRKLNNQISPQQQEPVHTTEFQA